MIRTIHFANTGILTRALWIILAAAIGLLIATQSEALILFMLVTAAFLLFAAINPLAAVAALLILAPMRTLIATEASFQLPLDIGQLALLAVAGFWFIQRIVNQQALPLLIWTPIYIPLLIFIVITGLTGFNALSMGTWASEWLKWVQMLIIVAVALSLARDSRWKWLLFLLILSGLANALVGLYEFLGGSGALHLLINNRFFRAFGTFGQPNPFGGFMGLLAPIALMAALAYGIRFWHKPSWQAFGVVLFYLVTTAFIILGVGISWSRGSWLGFAASMVVVALALPRKLWHGLALIACLGGLIGVLWLAGLLPASVVARISSSTEEFFAFADARGVDITPENYAVVERLSHWQAALNMAQANPWLGVGFGNYEAAYPAYRLINWHEPLGHAHNYYLNILAETGIIGLLGYGKVWLFIIGLNWRTRQHPDTLCRLIVVGLLGTWTYLSVHSVFDNLYVNNLFLHIGLMLGILAILYNQANHHVYLRTT
jgi:putative inorganic carbon (hco3(-)) transporter